MANPNEYVLASSMSAASSFTVELPTINYQLGAIHVLYTSMSAETGTIQVRGTNDPVARTAPASAKWSSLYPAITTLVSACDNRLFNISTIGYAHLQLQYAANTVTSGTVSIYASLKSYS